MNENGHFGWAKVIKQFKVYSLQTKEVYSLQSKVYSGKTHVRGEPL